MRTLRRNPDDRYHYEVGRIGNEATLRDRRTLEFSTCMRCLTAWCFVHGHATDCNDHGSGCFPLCDECWEELTPQERLPFYQVLWAQWRMQAVIEGRSTDDLDTDWPFLEANVLRGK